MRFMDAVFAGGNLIGAVIWTLLTTFSSQTVAWIVVAVVLAVGQWTVFLLRKIFPGQTLEEIAT